MAHHLLRHVMILGFLTTTIFAGRSLPPDIVFAEETQRPPTQTIRPIRGWMDLQGNRGSRGNHPENTQSAFDFALQSHMTTITLDINLTKDNQFILHHSPWVDEDLCLNSAGESAEETDIIEMSVQELKQLDCGSIIHDDFPEQVPVKGSKLLTLEELFEYFQIKGQTEEIYKSMRFSIQVVFPDDYEESDIERIATLLVATIQKWEMVDRATVQSFELRLLPLIKQKEKGILTAAMFTPSSFQALRLMIGLDANRLDIVSDALSVQADIIAPHYVYANAEFVQFCHDQNLIVIPWIVNEEEIMRDLFADGVDGMVSDYPKLLRQVYSKWRSDQKK